MDAFEITVNQQSGPALKLKIKKMVGATCFTDVIADPCCGDEANHCGPHWRFPSEH